MTLIPGSLATFSEPGPTALLLAVLGLLVAASVLFSRSFSRLGVPVVLLFLVVGMVGGSEGIGRVEFADYTLAVRLGTMALVLILFDGGLNTPFAMIRTALYPAGVMATVGVVLTAGLVALFAWALRMPWRLAMLLGAIVSSTDAAAVFSVLRGGGVRLEHRVGATIEVESCMNDPVAVVLTTFLIELFTSSGPHGVWQLLEIPIELAVGTGMGVILGYVGLAIINRVRLATAGLYPALTLALAFLSFGAATLVHGSGFLCVYVTAVIVGGGMLPYRSGMTRVHDALAWLSQIAMFLMLGLLVFPTRLLKFDVAAMGLAVALFLAVVARPLAALACLSPMRFPLKETLYIGWVGLRGAVPIVLATFPVLAHVEGAEKVFNIVFFVVLVSSIVPGATVRRITRRLKLDLPQRPHPSAVLEVNASHALDGDLLPFFIEPTVIVCGVRLAEIELPADVSVVLIVRGGRLIPARGDTVLQDGDHAYVFCRPPDRGFVELLFGRPVE